MPNDLESFAEHVRRQCLDIMGANLAGNKERVGILTAALCTEAAAIVQQKKMLEETTAPDRYDLATLPGPAPVREDD